MLLPALISLPLVAAILSLFPQRRAVLLEMVVLVATCAELVIAGLIAVDVVAGTPPFLGSYFAADALGTIVLLTLTVIAFATAIYSVGYLRTEVAKGIIGFHRVRQFFVLFHLFLFAMFFATLTTNPIMMWIAIEATTLSTAFLISFYNKASALEAAWKYLIINSVGLLLGFLGTLLFFTATKGIGASSFIDWATLAANAPLLDPLIAKIAFILVIIGYGTKIGFAPMHTWKPDAYSKAPTPIVALFSGGLVNVAFLAILRFKAVADITLSVTFTAYILIAFGVLSILIAAFIIFTQKNYKRLLAYSSIEHAGIMALGFGFGGIGTFAAILHMVYHSLAKSVLFLGAGNLFLKYSSTKIAQVGGALRVLPTTSVALILGFLAITGVPPFGTFLTELMILWAGMGAHPVAALLALIGIVLVFIGLLKHVTAMVWSDVPEGIEEGEASMWTTAPVIALILLLVVLSVYLPLPLRSLIESAMLSL